MKRIINLSIFLIVVSLLTTVTFGQSKSAMKQIGSKMGVIPQTQFVDLNGDGICDNFGTENQGTGKGFRGGNGTGIGTGTGVCDGTGGGNGLRPQDGTGLGRGNRGGNGTGTGVCDGSGPKGSGKKGNK